MRGPGYKITGDIRRTWRCPRCGCERKMAGDVTSLPCGCQTGTWMQIVTERLVNPRPLQRTSNLEMSPVDFGIEPQAPLPAKPEASIVKHTLSQEPDSALNANVIDSSRPPVTEQELPAATDVSCEAEEEWGEGIL